MWPSGPAHLLITSSGASEVLNITEVFVARDEILPVADYKTTRVGVVVVVVVVIVAIFTMG